jgi:Mg2+ and Co2+ transporter CorA
MDNNNDYMLELYTSFKNRTNSINTYLKRIEEHNSRITANVGELVSKFQEKYVALEQFNKTRVHGVNSNFATEASPSQESGDQTGESIKDIESIDAQINNYSQLLNHLYERAQGDTQFLVQSLQKSLDSVNKIYDTWVFEVEKKQNT